IVGDREACRTFLETTELPDGTEVFGPVDLEGADAAGRARAVVRLDPARSRELADALRAGVAARSARKAKGSLRVRLDPPDVFSASARCASCAHGRPQTGPIMRLLFAGTPEPALPSPPPLL